MQKKIKKAQIDTKLRKELKAIDKRIAKAKAKYYDLQAKYYDLLDLRIACKAIARLEKNGYKNLTTLEDFIKQAGLENEITQATHYTKEDILDFMDTIKPITSLVSSTDTIRMIRDGEENKLDTNLQAKQTNLKH
jgi:hypothetical protein